MPTSARKSSVGAARRGPQKAHIPYRGDNPEVGKKTGIAVQHVQRKSDGFEPFEEIMQQADGRTPPRPKGRKKITTLQDHDDEDYDDEYGEMSMQLDSPVHHLSSLRPPTTPTNLHRAGSTSRPVARTSDIDFDKIPSPRPRESSQRTMLNGGPGPSRLSRSTLPQSDEPSSDPPVDNYNDSGMDMDAGDDDFEDYGPREGEDHATPRRTSFTQIDEDQGEDEDEEQDETPRQRAKGKARAHEEEPEDGDEDIEDDIARGLSEVGIGSGIDEEEEDVEPPTQKKKVKIASEDTRPRTQTRSKSKKENRPHREGVRRSAREHYKPLEYWRGEKLVYGRPDFSGPVLVPHIREIVRIPKEQAEPFGVKRKRGRSRSKTVQPPPVAVVNINPEEGWDDATPSNVMVLDYKTEQPVDRRIAWTAKRVNPQPVGNNSWSFDKVFGDAEFIAAGQLIIPPNSRKPSKATKDNTYIFYVVEGAINLKIHDTSMVLATGGMFMVPRGNTYFIENIANRDAKLFFTQARKVMVDEEESVIALRNKNKKNLPRSSSAGPISAQRQGLPNGRGRSEATTPTAPAGSLAARAASTKL